LSITAVVYSTVTARLRQQAANTTAASILGEATS
jgi:hypothetical protein